jgi:hypothetical protein
MESKVKSHISNKTYLSNLDTLEEEDKDLKSELYMLPISGHKIMVSPGKSRMDENGIAFCYVYVVQREKVISKLGVYEKKSDSMPLIFDISTFPEGSFCLFEEFEKNPSKLLEFVMKEERTVFDFLIEEFPKIEDKKKTLKAAYKTIYETLMKEENKKDKEIKPILKVISAASKEESPTNAFLYTLKDAVTNEKTFVYTLLALQYVFKIEFRLKTENGFYQEIIGRWVIQDPASTVDVNVETYEIIESTDSETKPEAIDEADSEFKEPETEPKEDFPEDVLDSEFKQEPETEQEPEPEPEPEMGPSISLDETPKQVNLDDTPVQVLEPIPESKELEPEIEVKKTRKARTPKSDTKAKAESKAETKTKAKSKAESKDSMATPLGTSLNSGTKPIKVPSSKKIKMKSAVEKEN